MGNILKKVIKKVSWKLFKKKVFWTKGSFLDGNKTLKEHLLDDLEFSKQNNFKIKKGK